jgi:V/A-type H+-transporting ATPase subunit I
MVLHPKPARWFEAKIPRDQTVHALEYLAESGSVELEDKGADRAPCVDISALRHHLSAFEKLARRYADDLPTVAGAPAGEIQEPMRLAESAIAQLQQWVGRLLEARRQHRQAANELKALLLLEECLDAMGEASEGLNEFEHPTRFLYKQIFACPKGEIGMEELDKDVFEELFPGSEHDFWIVVGDKDRRAVLEGAAALLRCNPVAVPAWLPTGRSEQTRLIAERKSSARRHMNELDGTLANLRHDENVSAAIVNMRLLRWYQTAFMDRTSDRRACRIAGWTTANNPEQLVTGLADRGIQAEVVFAPPRSDAVVPVTLTDGRWSAPFRLFLDMMGIPGKNEVDPTAALSLIVPLLFGFMFPDLGHGIVLAVAGALLRRKYAFAVILVPCGLSAAGFGLVFGEFFGIHGLFPSPCGCPLDHPMNVLVATLILGVSLILLGLVFSGMEAWWRGEQGDWLAQEAPVILLYLSGVLVLVWPHSWIVSLGALCWYLLSALVLCRADGARCVLHQVGRLIDSALQLGLATISFLRVGAFALAHAAFSTVILELVRPIETPILQVTLFVVGHVCVMVVEGLIVMVQTTRLVLFEFFTRFLKFEGRIYKPLKKPGADGIPAPD